MPVITAILFVGHISISELTIMIVKSKAKTINAAALRIVTMRVCLSFFLGARPQPDDDVRVAPERVGGISVELEIGTEWMDESNAALYSYDHDTFTRIDRGTINRRSRHLLASLALVRTIFTSMFGADRQRDMGDRSLEFMVHDFAGRTVVPDPPQGPGVDRSRSHANDHSEHERDDTRRPRHVEQQATEAEKGQQRSDRRQRQEAENAVTAVCIAEPVTSFTVPGEHEPHRKRDTHRCAEQIEIRHSRITVIVHDRPIRHCGYRGYRA